MSNRISVKKYAGIFYTESSRHKNSRGVPDKTFWIYLRDSDGGQHWEKCGKASEGWTAEAANRRRHELLEKDRAGAYKPKKQREKEQITFKQLWAKYWEWAQDNLKQSRLENGKYALRLGPALDNKPLTKISPLDVERIRSDMKKEGKSDSTIYSTLATLRRCLNLAKQWGMFDGQNPCEAVTFPKPDNMKQRFLSQSEAAQLITALREVDTQLANMAVFSLFMGLRFGEICKLRWSDIRIDEGTVFVADPKNKDSRFAFITAPVRKVIETLPVGQPSALVFPNSIGTEMKWVPKYFMQTVNDLGFNKGVADKRQQVTFHSLRHSFGSWLAMNGISLYQISKSLGHKSTAMASRYSHLSKDSQRRAFESLAKFGFPVEENQREQKI